MSDEQQKTGNLIEHITVPIDHDVAPGLLLLLERHGATFEQLDCFEYDAHLPGGLVVKKLCSHHKITFPAGTWRCDTRVFSTARDFEIHFPDGLLIQGVHQSGMIGGDKTLIFTPQPE